MNTDFLGPGSHHLPPAGAVAEVWAAATINSRGMRSLEWSEPLLRANHLSHQVLA